MDSTKISQWLVEVKKDAISSDDGHVDAISGGNQVTATDKSPAVLMLQHDPMYRELIRAIDIVKDFVKSHGLVIYGGLAIDFALRKFGDQLYPDELNVPDIDVLSADNIGHAYKLADVLYHAGYDQARAFAGIFATTMKVDIGDNHFVIDISYCHSSVFTLIPRLEHAGLLFVHPDWQRIDTHSALSYPFDNPPSEVIFHRWSKDLTRLGLIDKYYPFDTETYDIKNSKMSQQTKTARPDETITLTDVQLPIPLLAYVLSGFAAYAFYYTIFINLVAGVTSARVIPAIMRVDAGKNSLVFPSLNTLDIIAMDPTEVLSSINASGARRYEAFGHLFSERVEVKLIKSGTLLRVFTLGHRLLSIQSRESSYFAGGANIAGVDKKMRVVGIQYLMRDMLAHSFCAPSPQLRNFYRMLYRSLLEMIRIVEAADLPWSESHIFYPSLSVYGFANQSLAGYLIENAIKHDVLNTPIVSKAAPYLPCRGRPPPEISYDSEIFRETGAEIR